MQRKLFIPILNVFNERFYQYILLQHIHRAYSDQDDDDAEINRFCQGRNDCLGIGLNIQHGARSVSRFHIPSVRLSATQQKQKEVERKKNLQIWQFKREMIDNGEGLWYNRHNGGGTGCKPRGDNGVGVASRTVTQGKTQKDLLKETRTQRDGTTGENGS